ncbi:hypothetical protein, partial [Bacillus velezensis]|uniref:hypothetical protein n=1 Tax=Bacillus velezensis TaxID=492670 RepID=UPI001C527852
LPLFQCGLRQAARLSGVDDKPHHHFFQLFSFRLRIGNIIEIHHTSFLSFLTGTITRTGID